jgi:hypothetical protein
MHGGLIPMRSINLKFVCPHALLLLHTPAFHSTFCLEMKLMMQHEILQDTMLLGFPASRTVSQTKLPSLINYPISDIFVTAISNGLGKIPMLIITILKAILNMQF